MRHIQTYFTQAWTFSSFLSLCSSHDLWFSHLSTYRSLLHSKHSNFLIFFINYAHSFFFIPSTLVLLGAPHVPSRPSSGRKAQPLSRGRSTDSRGPVWYLFWGRWRGEGCRECVFGRVGMKVRDEMRVGFCWDMRGWKMIYLIWVGRGCGKCGGLGWFLIHEWVWVACWEFFCEWMICSHELFLCVLFSCCFLFVCERWSGWKRVCLGCSWCCWMWIVFCSWGGLLVWWVDIRDEWVGGFLCELWCVEFEMVLEWEDFGLWVEVLGVGV